MRASFWGCLIAALLTCFGSGNLSAASDGERVDTAAQPAGDDKSYLPPWMQKQEATKPSSGETAAAADTATGAALAPDKAKDPNAKPVRKHRNDAFYWPGLGFFGR
jgi:hypothetical protein